jgi:non-specific serine/threonine protein kinase
LTASGAIAGTPMYMSPEQAQGELLDARSDVYALGIVLYELLIGRLPYEAETPLAVILKHLHEPVPLPSPYKPDLSPSLERVLRQALAKDKAERFATCAEFLAAWKQALSEATMQTPVVAVTAPTLTPPVTAIRHNLPLPPTSFIGREREIAEVKRLLVKADLTGTLRENLSGLSSAGLVTLTGAGGCGKTRLALQVAQDLTGLYADGMWFVALAALTDPALVPQTVAKTLGMSEQSKRTPTETLVAYLHNKHVLLLLDNCEHLLAACAQLVDELLQTCPQLRILATSREALNLAGEVAWPVPSLSLPPDFRSDEKASNFGSLTQYEAVQLFVVRATAVQPSFTLTPHTAPLVAQICQRLDGLPLAIELAAARVKMLTMQQIAMRLGDSLHLLAHGQQAVLPRQQTMRATIDWSYNLLSEQERTLFRRLAVFVGGFTLEAVEYVGQDSTQGGPYEILDVLADLVDQSLVVVEAHNEEGESDSEAMRYRLLEPIRQYAREKLTESGEEAHSRSQHLDYFLQLAEAAEPHVKNGQPVWLHRIEIEYDNIRVALEYVIATQPELAIRLGVSLAWFWDYSSRQKEGYAWATRILALTETWQPSHWRAMALNLAGGRSMFSREHQAAAREWLEAGLDMARMLGDTAALAWALHCLGALNYHIDNWAQMRPYAEELIALSQAQGNLAGVAGALWQLGAAVCGSGDNAQGHALFEQALALARKEQLPNLITFALTSLALLARLEGDYARANGFYEECAHIRKQMRHRDNLAGTLLNWGQVVLRASDAQRAKALFEESLAVYQELERAEGYGGATRGYVGVLAGLAGVAAITGKSEAAARLFGAMEAAYEMLDFKMNELARLVYDPIIANVRKQLGDMAFNATWQAGRTLTIEQAVAEAEHITAEIQPPNPKAQPPTPTDAEAAPAHLAGLTAREVEVLRCLVMGLSNPEIAEHLTVSRRTVDAHLHSIYSKLDVTTRTAAVRVAMEHKIV